MDARRYRIVSVLGKGGFGKVYRAVLEGPGGFHKDVAIKLLRDEDVPENTLRRFRDEARILGLVRDRAIVTVDPPTRLAGKWAVVMEYVDGASLQRLMSMGPMPAAAAAEVVQEIARVLDKVYRMPGPDGEPLRILHRDIKPANIQVTPDGEVKVLDFGIAKADFSAREAQTTAYVGGTKGYIAPERLEGVDTPAGDVFSLGVTLHCMITGEKPSRREAMGLEDPATQNMGPDAVAMVSLSGRMRSADPQERPTAREVEEACSRVRRRSDGISLREWAEKHVPRAVALKFSDEMVGSVLTESDGGLPSDERPIGRRDPVDEETADHLASGSMRSSTRSADPLRPSDRREPPRPKAPQRPEAGRSADSTGRSSAPGSGEAGRPLPSRAGESTGRSPTSRAPDPTRPAPGRPELGSSFGAPKLSDEPTVDLEHSGILRPEDLELDPDSVSQVRLAELERSASRPAERDRSSGGRPAELDRPSGSRPAASPKSLVPGRPAEIERADLDRSSASGLRDPDRPSGSRPAASPRSLAPGRPAEIERASDLDRSSGSRPAASPRSLAPGRPAEIERASDLDRASGSRPAASPKSLAPGRPAEIERASDLDRSSGSRPAASPKSMAPRPSDDHTRVLDRSSTRNSMVPGRPAELDRSGASRAPSMRPQPLSPDPAPLDLPAPEQEERSTASWLGLAMMGTLVGGGLGGVTVLVLIGLFFLGSELLEPAPPPMPLGIAPSTSLPALSIDPLPLPGELVTPEVAPGFELPEEETDTPAPKKVAKAKPPPEPVEEPLPPVAGAKTRDLTFSSVPLGTDVYVDGVRLGQTPLIGVKVTDGKHEVKLISDAETLIRRIVVGRKNPSRYVWKGGDLWELHY